MPGPTYWTEVPADGKPVYHCLMCAAEGKEHHSTDEAAFIAHQEQRHDGRMVEGTEADAKKPEDAPEHPHGGPPGQTGEHPVHPHGGPPGQTVPPVEPVEPVDPNAPHPEHPIVDPDAPYVEHHEEPKP